MTEDISGVILAGGDSRRFKGMFKPDIIVGGKTIFTRIINVIGDIFKEIIISTNNPERFSDFPDFKAVKDIFTKAGPLGGIHAAMMASSGKAVFVFAGDMPYLDKVIILREIDLFSEKKCDAVVPLLNNFPEPLHSVYSNSLVRKLESYLKNIVGLDIEIKQPKLGDKI